MEQLGYRKKLLLSYIGNVPLDARILDVGCGEGDTLEALVNAGYTNLSGVDVVETEGIKMLKDKITFRESTIEQYLEQADSESFDFIIMADILEHIEGDVVVLEGLSKKLKSGGKLLLCVPAYQFLWGVDDEMVGHYRRYSKASLKAAIDGLPIKILDVKYLGFPFYLTARIFNNLLIRAGLSKKTAGTAVISAAQKNPLLTKIVSMVVAIEMMFNKFPFGQEIIVAMEKK